MRPAAESDEAQRGPDQHAGRADALVGSSRWRVDVLAVDVLAESDEAQRAGRVGVLAGSMCWPG